MSKNILVTGSTGFIGQNLVNKLVEEEFDILVAVRDKSKAKNLFSDSVEYIVGDLFEESIISKSLKAADVVFHLAGQIGEWGIDKKKYEQVNFTLTKKFLDVAIKTNIKQFIFCSSAGVLGPTPNGKSADENYCPSPSNDYEKSKAKAEEYVLSKKENIPVTILRPEFVYGEKDLHVLGLFKQIKKGVFPFFDKGKSLLHPTYIKDVLNAFFLVLNNPKCYGEVYNVSGLRPYTVKEYVKKLEEIMGKRTIKINIPKKLGLLIASFTEWFGEKLNINPPLTKSMVKFFSENRYYSSKKIQDLGLELTPLSTGLENTIKYYKEKNLL